MSGRKGYLTPLLVRPTGSGFYAELSQVSDRWQVVNPFEVTLSTHPAQAEAESVAAIMNEKHEGFEIAAGHRRYRAAKEVGLTEVPAVIREMSDAEFMEVITIENLQREDVHPLDEADGYNRLITVCGYDVPGIAARIAKDESYVYRRLKLRDLTEKIQEAFLHDKITLGHAILIARLQPKDQEEAFKAAFDQWGEKELKSVRSLENWIDREIHLDLHSASFSKKDVDLVPGVGPCTTCVKRTGFAPALFPDIKKKDVCTDPSCFKAKVQAFVSIWIEKKSADSDVPPLKLSSEYDHRQTKADGKKPLLRNQYHEIEKKKDRCSSAKEGIIVAGREVGRVMTVCADPECKIHHGSIGRYQEDPKEKARRKAELEKQKMKTITQERILKAVLEKVTSPLTVDEVRIIAGETFIRAWHELRKRIVAAHGLEPGKTQWGGKDFDKPMKGFIANANEVELNRFLVELSVAPQVWGGGAVFGENNLATIAAGRNVDVEAIETQVKEEFKAKRERSKKKLLALAKKEEEGRRKNLLP